MYPGIPLHVCITQISWAIALVCLLALSLICKFTSCLILCVWELRLMFTRGIEKDVLSEKLTATLPALLCAPAACRTSTSVSHPTCAIAPILQMGKLRSGQEEGEETHTFHQGASKGRRRHSWILLHHVCAMSLTFAGVQTLPCAPNAGRGTRNKGKSWAERRGVAKRLLVSYHSVSSHVN